MRISAIRIAGTGACANRFARQKPGSRALRLTKSLSQQGSDPWKGREGQTGLTPLGIGSRSGAVQLVARFHTVLFEFSVKGLAVQSEDAGGGGFVSFQAVEDMQDIASFDFLHRQQF